MSHEAQANANKLAILRDRAAMLAASRHFFAARDVLEVDCPACTEFAALDAHIDLFNVKSAGSEVSRYLHSSPEYGMKRLLAQGLGDIFQLSHVFRAGEIGNRHNPEFTMVEWYRCGFSFEQMIDETAAFAELFCGKQPMQVISYRAALQQFAAIDYPTATDEDLIRKLEKCGVSPSSTLLQGTTDDLLNVLMATTVEPHLGCGMLTAIIDYPASQGALAETTVIEGVSVAKRFEIYFKGYELANGYQELRDKSEQKRRFLSSNEDRCRLGKDPLPIDEKLLYALECGLPPCCGVAVGFDRLMMLRHHTDTISDVIPFAWDDS